MGRKYAIVNAMCAQLRFSSGLCHGTKNSLNYHTAIAKPNVECTVPFRLSDYKFISPGNAWLSNV